MAIFVALVSFLAFLFDQVWGSGYETLVTALIFATISAVGSLYFSSKIILAISKAHRLEEKDDQDLHRLIESVCRKAQMPKPEVYLINDSAPNAFATGRNPEHAVICFTTGILAKLNQSELEGVIAHELSHIQNYDIRFMALVSVLVGSVTLLSDWFLRSLWFRGRSREEDSRGLGALSILFGLVLMVISPIFAYLIQLAISRRREFLADYSSVLLTHNPRGLADALEKIAADRDPLEVVNRATAHLYIANPLKGDESSGWLRSIFSTHPSVVERVRILRSM